MEIFGNSCTSNYNCNCKQKKSGKCGLLGSNSCIIIILLFIVILCCSSKNK